MPAMTRLPTLLFGLCAGAFAAPWSQDPKPAPAEPPPATAPAPADAKPAAAPRTPHALEGVYELRARVVDGKPDRQPNRGYLAITQRHLFLCLGANGPDPEKPLLRAGVRTWQPVEAFVDGVVQLGWHTNADGTITVEKKGVAERRRIDPIAGGVRIWQDSRNWLDFERVE